MMRVSRATPPPPRNHQFFPPRLASIVGPDPCRKGGGLVAMRPTSASRRWWWGAAGGPPGTVEHCREVRGAVLRPDWRPRPAPKLRCPCFAPQRAPVRRAGRASLAPTRATCRFRWGVGRFRGRPAKRTSPARDAARHGGPVVVAASSARGPMMHRASSTYFYVVFMLPYALREVVRYNLTALFTMLFHACVRRVKGAECGGPRRRGPHARGA